MAKALETEHCIGSLRQTFLSGGLGNDEPEHQEPQLSILEPTPKKTGKKASGDPKLQFPSQSPGIAKSTFELGEPENEHSQAKAWKTPNNTSDT